MTRSSRWRANASGTRLNSTFEEIAMALRRSVWVTVCVGALAGIYSDAAAVRAQNTSTSGAVALAQAPAPWQGEPGITESVDDIMTRELAAAPLARPAISIRSRNRQHDRNPNLPQHPAATAVASWPEASAGATAAEFQPQVVGTNFLGVQASESGFIPPDSMGAVGPDQILVVVNGRIKVFDKVGNPGALNASTDVFFQSVLPAL